MVATSAIIGISGIATNGLGETGMAAMGSAIVIAIASLFCLVCTSVWHTGAALVVSRGGVATTVLAATLMIYAMWATPHHADNLFKGLAASSITAVGCVHACILVRAKLAPTRQWLRTVALASSCLCGFVLVGAVVSESESHAVFAFAAILFIVVGAMTVLVALESWNAQSASDRGADVCYCPGCGRSMWSPSGQIRCAGCGSSYVVTKLVVEDLPLATLR